MPGHHRRPFWARIGARNDTPIGITFLTSRRSAAVWDSEGDQVKNLTPTSGPNSLGIAARATSACWRDARAIASPTGEVGILCWRLKQVTAVPECTDHLAEPVASSTETVAAAGARRGACRAAAPALPPPILRASRR
jgi:hypothetical protein